MFLEGLRRLFGDTSPTAQELVIWLHSREQIQSRRSKPGITSNFFPPSSTANSVQLWNNYLNSVVKILAFIKIQSVLIHSKMVFSRASASLNSALCKLENFTTGQRESRHMAWQVDDSCLVLDAHPLYGFQLGKWNRLHFSPT